MELKIKEKSPEIQQIQQVTKQEEDEKILDFNMILW